MKTLLRILPVILLVILATSCKKDEPSATGSLLGTWKFTSQSLSGCTDPSNNGTDVCTTGCGTLTITATTWTFADPIPSNSGNGTYTTSGNSITITVTSGSGPAGTYTYAIAGSVLTFSDTNYGGGCTGQLNFTRI